MIANFTKVIRVGSIVLKSMIINSSQVETIRPSRSGTLKPPKCWKNLMAMRMELPVLLSLTKNFSLVPMITISSVGICKKLKIEFMRGIL